MQPNCPARARPDRTPLWRSRQGNRKANRAAPHTPSQATEEDLKRFDRIEDRLPMLYNVSADPGEQNDLVLKHLDRTRSMLEELGRWEVQSPNPMFREPYDWRSRYLKFYDSDYQMVQPE